jgi:1,4-alpha-glucan branching enzyme
MKELSDRKSCSSGGLNDLSPLALKRPRKKNVSMSDDPRKTPKAEAKPAGAGDVVHGPSLFTEGDIYLFKEGSHFRLYEKMGAHPMTALGSSGTFFAVWAPNAEGVAVIGDFNGWDPERHPLGLRWDDSGIWEGFIPGLGQGASYKYAIRSKGQGPRAEKGDPYAFFWEVPPRSASIVWDLDYRWGDADWLAGRGRRNRLDGPISIYEVHLGSWRRVPEEGNRFLTYREIAPLLAAYVKEMGFTHVEIMPVMEHPFYGSWGYQTVGYFAPTSRYGSPQDFMYLVDHLHQNGIGVILDWVPSHFAVDGHGLTTFDGTHLYEHMDPKQGYHPDWKSSIFNYGRNEVRDFLTSSAFFWLDRFHADGLRIDAVASMLYLDYSRKEGEWIPNAFGGRENLEALAFIKRFNEAVYGAFPDVQTFAEESTAWPMVTRPVYVGGLGFGLKWNMGWMHDILEYFSKDPILRKFRHDALTFSMWYAFTENFVLPLSHDEVVHGKGSLVGKMPGFEMDKYANLKALFGLMFTHPGKKLIFMGDEFAQWREWAHDESLEWHALDFEPHRGVQRWVGDLNALYRREPALYELDFEPAGFEWADFNDVDQSVIGYLRKGSSTRDIILVVGNFTPVPRENYLVGVPEGGFWKEVLNSDASEYGGGGRGNYGGAEAQPHPIHGRDHSLRLTLPPLGLLIFKKETGEKGMTKEGTE